jgi:c-di-GMP-binding flagellar brake protein YcgR
MASLYDIGKPGHSFFFPIGTPLQIEIDGVTVRMGSISVGCLPDTCLIIKYPSTQYSIASKLYKGNKVTVRYISGGNALAFQSDLLGVTNEPVRLLFITYPVFIAHQSLRSSKRLACYLPADAIPLKGGVETVEDQTYGGIIADISSTGCSFNMIKETPDQVLPEVKVQDRVILHLQLPGIENRIRLAGEVKRTQRDSNRTGLGIEFVDLDEDAKAKILSYISALEKFDQGQ